MGALGTLAAGLRVPLAFAQASGQRAPAFRPLRARPAFGPGLFPAPPTWLQAGGPLPSDCRSQSSKARFHVKGWWMSL